MEESLVTKMCSIPFCFITIRIFNVNQGEFYDKSTIHLPRQYFNTAPQPLILQGVLLSRDDFTKFSLKIEI